MIPLLISTATKTHQLLVRSLESLQVFSAVSAKSVKRHTCTITVCNSRSANRDNGGERHSQAHHKRITTRPRHNADTPKTRPDSTKKEQVSEETIGQILPIFRALSASTPIPFFIIFLCTIYRQWTTLFMDRSTTIQTRYTILKYWTLHQLLYTGP